MNNFSNIARKCFNREATKEPVVPKTVSQTASKSVDFSRIARKYFADEQQLEQPKEAEKAEPAKDELLELLKHVQEHGLKEKMTNQQFFDANKKLFMDKFLMNGEKKRTPKEFMDAVREYGKKNGLEGVVHWVLDGKTDGLKSDEPAEKSNKVVEESSKQASDKPSSSDSQTSGTTNTSKEKTLSSRDKNYEAILEAAHDATGKSTDRNIPPKKNEGALGTLKGLSFKDAASKIAKEVAKHDWSKAGDQLIEKAFPEITDALGTDVTRDLLIKAADIMETKDSALDVVKLIWMTAKGTVLSPVLLVKALWKGLKNWGTVASEDVLSNW